MQLFERDRQTLGLPSGMQMFERELPGSDQWMANDWNHRAAIQWSERQNQLRNPAAAEGSPFADLGMIGDPNDYARAAARQYSQHTSQTGPHLPPEQFTAQLPYMRHALPGQRNLFQKQWYGRDPEEELQFEGRKLLNQSRQESLLPPAAKPIDYAAMDRNYEQLYGSSPYDVAQGYDPFTQQSSVAGRQIRNPAWNEYSDADVPQFLPGPARTFPRYAAEEAMKLMEPRGFMRKPEPKPLDPFSARKLLSAAGGDENKAQQMAKQQGALIQQMPLTVEDPRRARAMEALNDPEATPEEKMAARRILGIP